METKDAALLGFVSAAEKFVNNHLTDGTDLGELKDINISKLKNELSDELKSLGLTEKYKKELNKVGENAFADYAEEHFGIKKSNVMDELGEIFSLEKEEQKEEEKYEEKNIEESFEETSKKINALLDAYDFSVDTQEESKDETTNEEVVENKNIEKEKIEEGIEQEETVENNYKEEDQEEIIAKPSENLKEIFNEVLEHESTAQDQEVDEFGLTKDDDVFLRIANAAAKSDEELARVFEEEPVQENIIINNSQQENKIVEPEQPEEDLFSEDITIEEEIHEEAIDTNDILERQPVIEESITENNGNEVDDEETVFEQTNQENISNEEIIEKTKEDETIEESNINLNNTSPSLENESIENNVEGDNSQEIEQSTDESIPQENELTENNVDDTDSREKEIIENNVEEITSQENEQNIEEIKDENIDFNVDQGNDIEEMDEPIEAMEIIDTNGPATQEEKQVENDEDIISQENEDNVNETTNIEQQNDIEKNADSTIENFVLEDNQKENVEIIDDKANVEKIEDFNNDEINQEESVAEETVNNNNENRDNQEIEEPKEDNETTITNEETSDNVQDEEIREFYDLNAEETNVNEKIEYDPGRVPLSVELRRLKGEDIVEIPEDEPVQEEKQEKKDNDVITPVSIFDLNPFGSEGGTYIPPVEDTTKEPVKTEIPANFGYIVNPVLDIVLEQEKEASENFYSNDIFQEDDNKEEDELKAKKYIEKLITNPGFAEPREKSKTLSSIIAGLDNLRKRQEDKKILEEEYKQNEEIYEDIMSAYPYLDKSFIKAVYSQKEDIENEYVEDGTYILLHRLVFSDLDELHEFVEIMMAHDYAVNVDEKQMIVDTFREIINEDGIIIANILGIANQSMILNGKYDGYCVLDRDRILYS